MSLKSKFAHKFYIKQFIINNISCQEWMDRYYSDITKNTAIIGYLFSVKEGDTINSEARVLNLYLIDRNYYNGQEVTMNNLTQSWELFLLKSNTEKNHKNKNVFLNPPIQQWLDSKNNWCKKVASQLSKQYNWEFDEMLSEVYYAIMYCYSKGTVYMGNLGYIKTAINNFVLMSIRRNKTRVNQDSGLALSLNTIMTEDSDDESLTLMDMLESNEVIDANVEYNELKTKVMVALKKHFSDKEIDQLFNTKPVLLPMGLYRRLLHFRHTHKLEDIYDEKNC